jgi:hypothetical protein
MEVAHTSQTSVSIQLRIWQYILEDSELHTRHRQNLKSHAPHFVSPSVILFLFNMILLDDGANPRWFTVSTSDITGFALTWRITFNFSLKVIFRLVSVSKISKSSHLQTVH